VHSTTKSQFNIESGIKTKRERRRGRKLK